MRAIKLPGFDITNVIITSETIPKQQVHSFYMKKRLKVREDMASTSRLGTETDSPARYTFQIRDKWA